MTIKSITSGQRKQFKRFVEDAAEHALREVDLDKEGLQKLFANGGEFQEDIVASIKKYSISKFTDEEVKSLDYY
jgi:hypothetical protein